MTPIRWVECITAAAATLLAIDCTHEERSCTPTAARTLGEAAFLASPVLESKISTRMTPRPERIETYVKRQGSMFGENGDAIRCARALGPYLVAKGASAYDTAAYAANMGGGPDELRPDVVSSLKGQAVAIIALGRELSWLAEVLPSLANGDSVPYWSTATAARRQYREIGNPALDLLIDQGDDCGGCTLIGTLAVAEEQAKLTPQEVYVLAMMMRSAP